MRTCRVAVFPEPLDFFVFLITLILPLPMHPFGFVQSLADKVHFFFRCRNAALRLLLKCVQHINCVRIADGIHRSPCIAEMTSNNLQDRASTKTSQRFGRWIGLSLLRCVKSLSDIAPDRRWKGPDIFPARSNPDDNLGRWLHYT